MRKIIMTLAALATTMAFTPALTTAAEAHSRGEKCYYQKIDRNGVVRSGSDYCHHLPGKYQKRPSAGLTLYFDFANGGYYFDSRPRRGKAKNRQEHVCLVTFYKRSQVEAGKDKNVQRARYLTERQAERRDGPNDRQRIFDYGSDRKTRETCRYLDRLN